MPVRPKCKRATWQRQRDDVLGFARVLDGKLAAIAQRRNTALLGAAGMPLAPQEADVGGLLAALE